MGLARPSFVPLWRNLQQAHCYSNLARAYVLRSYVDGEIDSLRLLRQSEFSLRTQAAVKLHVTILVTLQPPSSEGGKTVFILIESYGYLFDLWEYPLN